MKKFNILIFCTIPLLAFGQQPPGTEIFLFDMKIKKESITLSNPVNISNHAGYDNQPYFHPDKPLIYYSSANEEGKTDILEYNYQSKTTRKITNTSEREYSPTLTPDKQFLSCIIQRDSGAQDLGKYPVDGGEPVILLTKFLVGYHAWIDHNRLVTFVLPQPFKLHLIDLSTGLDSVVAENIGRSLHKIPGEDAISFVQQQPDKSWIIKKMDSKTLSVKDIVAVKSEKEPIITWTSGMLMLRSEDQQIHFLKPGNDSGWKTVEVQSSMTFKSFSRMALNRNSDKIAVVVSE